jgi:uncharacterized protein (TIGR03437 family)
MKTIVLAFTLCAAIQAQPTITSVFNGFSYTASFSPGALASIAGTNLVVGTTAPTVTLGSVPCYVLAGGIPTQVNIQLPVNANPGPATLMVTIGGQSASTSITLTQYSPGLDQQSAGLGVFVDSITQKVITAAAPATPSELLTIYATGLGPTNPAVATGVNPTGQTPTVATVTATLGSTPVTVSFAGLAYVGTYQINLVVPKTATGCATNFVITVGGANGASSPAVTLPVAVTTPVVCAVENSATGSIKDATHGAAANSFLSVYALGLGNIPNSTGNLFPATSYQGLQVEFNGTPLPLYNVIPTANLINTMLPANAGTSGTGTITVIAPTGTSTSYTIELAPADVGVFRMPNPNDATMMQGAALVVGTYQFVMPASLAPVYDLPTPCTGLSASTPCAQPAAPGQQIVIYFTGASIATPSGAAAGAPLPLGTVAPADGSVLYKTVETPVVTIGGLPAEVVFSGIAPGTAAEYQLNVNIPNGVAAGNEVPVAITMSGSTDTVTIAIQAP